MAGSTFYLDNTPEEAKNASGIHLFTQSTPNGQKVQILLEELAIEYDVTWTTTLINIFSNEQKKDWFLRLNPNGKIPVIVDNRKEVPFPVIETSAELVYLATNFDKKHLVSFEDPSEASEALQWLFFWHGSGAPYQGQLTYFGKFAKEKIPHAIERFRNETLRVYGALELQLSGKLTGQPRKYLAGHGEGKYSIADIGTWPWVSKWEFVGFSLEEMQKFPYLLDWIARISERPAVKTALGEKYQKK